jgi:hypothetical protein
MIDIHYINLHESTDRLGSQLCIYISIILVAIKNNYRINLTKPKTKYRYYNSIFVTFLFDFIEEYNEKEFGIILRKESEIKKIKIKEDINFWTIFINGLKDIKSDYITYFKENIFKDRIEHFNKLVLDKKYIVPINFEKTIVVHLRLDDRRNTFHNKNDILNYSNKFKEIVNTDNNNFTHPGYLGQSAIKEDIINERIKSVLVNHPDHDVVIITSPNSNHSLPYKTIKSSDESYDLFLLSKCNILIGSMSTFSFSAMFYGNHAAIYYPLWDHAVIFGLTTKYDKTTNITLF